MKKIFLFIVIALFASCGSTRKSQSSEASTSTQEQVIIDRATEASQSTSEKTTETEVTESGSERTTEITETTTVTEFSAPDSLGNQHKVKETTTVKQTNETEAKGSAGVREVNSEKSNNLTVYDTLHVERATAEQQTTAVVDEKERKGGIGGYLWAFIAGVVATVGVWVGIRFYRKGITII